jgi:integral membrane sensor domain MASE1
VFGAGEGGLSRFAEFPRQHMEIHSSVGTVLFSYGVVGILLFTGFFWSLIGGAPLRLAVVLVPPLLYTVAHQGLRFTMMWVLFAIFLSMKATREPTPQRSFAT